VVGFVLVGTVIPFACLNAGLQRVGSSRGAILSIAEMVPALIWSALFLGETLLPVQLLGGALIIASITLLQLRQSRLVPVEV
jgi:drug/metabolite transporter (DMT)-like permease